MSIIPPRRNEPLTGDGGVGTRRTMEYLELTAETVNEVVVGTPIAIEEQIFALEGAVQKSSALISELESEVDQLSSTANQQLAVSDEIEKALSDVALKANQQLAESNELQNSLNDVISIANQKIAESDEINKELIDTMQLMPNFGKLNALVAELTARIEDLEQQI